MLHRGPHIDATQSSAPDVGRAAADGKSTGAFSFVTTSQVTSDGETSHELYGEGVSTTSRGRTLGKRRSGRSLHHVAPQKAILGTKTQPPLPKRPKGRLFVGVVLWALVGGLAFGAWDTFFRFEAYGLVTGRVITVAAPWDGVLKTLHCREGETFRQGDLLFTLDNLALRRQRDQLHDELRIAQADLDAKIAELKYQLELNDDRSQRAQAEHYELWGNALRERATLMDLRATRDQYAKIPAATSLVTTQERERVIRAERHQTEVVKKMIAALRESQLRVDQLSQSTVPRVSLKPDLVRLDSLQKSIAQLNTQLQQGEVRATVAGRVIRRQRFAGEHVTASQSLCEVLEDGSKEIVIYVPQELGRRYQPGQYLRLRVEPWQELIPCRIDRWGEVMGPAPPAIAHHYRKNASLIPIFLQPELEGCEKLLRLGGEVRLPMERRRRWEGWWDTDQREREHLGGSVFQQVSETARQAI